MTDQAYGRCRGCGKQILWTRTASGKNMPCDPEVLHFTPTGIGPEIFVTPDGRIIRGERTGEGLIGYAPHWGTCPERDKFRKEKK